MSKLFFHCGIYWDLHWMYRVIRELNAPVYTTVPEVRKLCEDWGIEVIDSYSGYEFLVVTNMHLHSNKIAKEFKAAGGKLIIMQHAWDSFLHLTKDFWGVDMNAFDYYLVGSTQDYSILSEMYGERIVLTGIPKLDDLLRVKESNKDLSCLYEETKSQTFYLSSGPTSAITANLENVYINLPLNTGTHIVFKLHPGGSFSESTVQDIWNHNQATFLNDDKENPMHTYELMKLSKAVICIESFMSIEASLLEKPVVFWGHEHLPSDFYDKSENVKQNIRAPLEMSSSLEKPEYKEKQKEIASLYLFDGKNTKRCVDFLKGLV